MLNLAAMMQWNGSHRLRNYLQANPAIAKIVLPVLSFMWVTIVGGTLVSGALASIKPVWVVIAALAATAIMIFALAALALGQSAWLYYRVLLALYSRCSRLSSHNPVRRVLHSVFKDDSSLELIAASLLWDRRRRPAPSPSSPQPNREVAPSIYRRQLFQPGRRPPVVRREHLGKHALGHDQAFSIVLLFNPISLHCRGADRILSVDLRYQSCAIYNNRGKQFIYESYLPLPSDRAQLLRLSEETHDFLMGRTDRALTVQVDALRWASGGFLPVVNWRQRKWVCLLFRDIYPVGWNLANGASETKDEYKQLDALVYREMMEELVVVEHGLRPGMHAVRSLLHPPGPTTLQVVSEPPRLVHLHDTLREEHDRIRIGSGVGRALHERRTHHKVCVTYHDLWQDAGPIQTDNVLVSINPTELGIEAIRIGEFDLGDDEVILDGEVFESSRATYLVRRPVLLLATDYLRRRFEAQQRSLGTRVTPDDGADRKSIGNVPRTEYHLFLDDIELRRQRLTHLEQAGMGDSPEAFRVREWMERMGASFAGVADPDSAGPTGDLAYLLPATWKAVELALEQDLI